MLQHFLKTLKRNSYLLVAVLLIAIGFNMSGGFARLTYADTACPNNLSSLSSLGLPAYCNVVGSDSTGLLTHIINLLLAFLGVIAVLFIIIGGYRMIASNGDEKSFEKGQRTVTYAVIGLVVAVLAFTIITVIGNTLGGSAGSSSTTSGSGSSTTNGAGTSGTSGTSGTAATSPANCSTLTDAGGIQYTTTDANKNPTTTFNSGDQVYFISKAGNPLVAQCNIAVSVASSSSGNIYSTSDSATNFSEPASSLVAGGSGTTTITWTYINPAIGSPMTNGTASTQITVNPATVSPTGGSYDSGD